MTNGTCKVIIDGKDINLKFGYPAIKWFMESAMKNMDVFFILSGKDDDKSVMTDYGVAKLMECAYKNDCLIKEVEPEYGYGFFVNFAEQENANKESTALADVLKVYAESSISKRITENSEKEKKNQNQTSTPSSG